jgi:hypothetical protein
LVVEIFGPLEHPIVEPFSVVNAEDFHALVIVEVGQQLGCDQEILGGASSTRLLHQLSVYQTFIALKARDKVALGGRGELGKIFKNITTKEN